MNKPDILLPRNNEGRTAEGDDALQAPDAEMRQALFSRRSFVVASTGTVLAGAVHPAALLAQAAAPALNLASVAVPASAITSSENKLTAMNNGVAPRDSYDRAGGMYALRPEFGAHVDTHWVEYGWSVPIAIDRVEIYWAVDRPRPAGYPGTSAGRVAAPAAYRLLYWDGHAFLPVPNPTGLGVQADTFNSTRFRPVKTSRLRLQVDPQADLAAGVLEWGVYSEGPAPALAPVVQAGVDRSAVLGAPTYLAGKVSFLRDVSGNTVRWTKASGPGSVLFQQPNASVTTAHFSQPGEYELTLTGSGSAREAASRLHVHVEPPPPPKRLEVVYTTRYSIQSPLWNARAKALIVEWIPHCIAYCERTDIAANRGDGGLDNFLEAGKAQRGEAHNRHKGYVFSNAWVHQTVESMCIALMVDAAGDADILRAQAHMRSTLERWIPVILQAQMPDGYLQTAYTLADRTQWPERWSPQHRANHEGYVAGYFIESAINHYTLTEGKDLRLYNAAKKLADCWVSNLGPGRKEWFDGHQEMEQALVRFGRFVNDQEGHGRGDAYIALAKFLLDSRRGGSEYDQSHVPPGQQYEAVGHAVRATYFYSGMADIAAETGDPDYQSAVLSLWDNMVNRKYYLTGGIGSGETSEGFGPNYSLRNNSYCESCSSCGLIFFQYKLNLAYHDAKYADLYEQTMYNALLGSVALDGKTFCYTNPLVDTDRAAWHTCPCCVGNIARTLLMIPTWTYLKGPDALYVNLFIGSRVHVGQVAGTDVEVVQQTDYPWKGAVALTVNPRQARTFAVHIRVPNRHTSKLYSASPAVAGLLQLRVNGKAVTPVMQKGYAVITREWKAGDRVELELPMVPQQVRADHRIQADADGVALQFGPLVYSVEQPDNKNISQGLGTAPLKAEWRPDLLGGVVALTGTWQDGSAMTAVPYYARMNRTGEHEEYPRDTNAEYAPGATTGNGNGQPNRKQASSRPAPGGSTSQAKRPVQSKVWIG